MAFVPESKVRRLSSLLHVVFLGGRGREAVLPYLAATHRARSISNQQKNRVSSRRSLQVTRTLESPLYLGLLFALLSTCQDLEAYRIGSLLVRTH